MFPPSLFISYLRQLQNREQKKPLPFLYVIFSKLVCYIKESNRTVTSWLTICRSLNFDFPGGTERLTGVY